MGCEKGLAEPLPSLRRESRDNNFTMVRLIATFFVFAGHMGMILDGNAPRLGRLRLHEIGVSILFLISGYLITKSWLSDSHPLRYGVRRFLRLWPPFAVMVLLMVFVFGPLLSSLGVRGYFKSWYTVYLQNLRFMIVYAQPGVFEDLTIPYTTNGSLWTMPVEAALYVLTPIVVTAVRMKKNTRASFPFMAALTLLACAFDLYLRLFFQDRAVIFYGTDLTEAFHLLTFYLIGMLFTYGQIKKLLNLQTACLLLCVSLAFMVSEDAIQYIILYFVLPYVVFSFVFQKNAVFRGCFQRLEPSYGIYLYGFFFEQLVASWKLHRGISLGYTGSLFLSAVPTVLAAVLSCLLIEKPVQKLSRSILGFLKKG